MQQTYTGRFSPGSNFAVAEIRLQDEHANNFDDTDKSLQRHSAFKQHRIKKFMTNGSQVKPIQHSALEDLNQVSRHVDSLLNTGTSSIDGNFFGSRRLMKQRKGSMPKTVTNRESKNNSTTEQRKQIRTFGSFNLTPFSPQKGFNVTEQRKHDTLDNETNTSTWHFDNRMHSTFYQDLLEQTQGDLDQFLTKVSQMPAASQTRVLQEKVLILNEQLTNVLEEMQHIKGFHSQMQSFLRTLQQKVVDEQRNEEQVLIDSDTRLMIATFTNRGLQSLKELNKTLTQLAKSPTLKQTFKSETQELNELKNCEYHRAKIKQFLADYNLCVEENIRLKETNDRLNKIKANL